MGSLEWNYGNNSEDPRPKQVGMRPKVDLTRMAMRVELEQLMLEVERGKPGGNLR